MALPFLTMNPLQYLRNLRRNVFPTTAELADQVRKDVPAPSVPEPSCWAKGIALSIRTQPDEWADTTSPYGGHTVRVKHVEHEVEITVDAQWWPLHPACLSGCEGVLRVSIDPAPSPCTTLDLAHIAQAFDQQPFGRLKERKDAELRWKAREQAAHDHFAKLGRPN